MIAATPPVARRRLDVIFLIILAAALFFRFHLATAFPYIHDEENTSIPLAQSISFEPANRNLPIRAINHPALPAYFVKAGSTLFGTTPLAYRSIHVLASICTIAAIFFLASQWYGPVAARWAAALLAFNEYFLAISSRATAHIPYLFFVAAALYAFSRFLRTQRPVYLYATGLSVGLAFYCKEHSVLLLPVFLVTLLHASYRHWWRRPHVYLACAMFFVVIGPDIYWNLTTNKETARVPFRKESVGYATYRNHLQRIGGIGLSAYPSMFYARDPVSSLHLRATGEKLDDNTPEYHSMNPALGVLLLGAVLASSFRPIRRDALRRFLLVLFWSVFGFFTLIRRGNPEGLDPVSWIWVDVTMLPAVILTGAWLAEATGKWRIAAWVFSGGALLYAGARMMGS